MTVKPAMIEPADDPVTDGPWVTVGQLAEMKGISHQGVSKRLRRYREQGLLAVRRDASRTLVNLAEWDAVTAQYTDPARMAGLATSRHRARQSASVASGLPDRDPDDDPIFAREQARKAQYDADLKKLELDRQLGRLLDVRDVEAATIASAEVIVNAIDQLPWSADDFAAALAAGGVPALRKALRAKARELRSTIENGMVGIVGCEVGGDDEERRPQPSQPSQP